VRRLPRLVKVDDELLVPARSDGEAIRTLRAHFADAVRSLPGELV